MKVFLRSNVSRPLFLGFLLPVSVFLVVSSIRLFQLPGAWYGDISEEHEYLSRILTGEYPYTFAVGAGPVYHYLITPIVAALGQSLETYKIASVIVGAIGIVGIYLLALELSSRRVAFFSALIAALSFWYISWVRTGSTPVVVAPLLSSLTVVFAVRFRKHHRLSDVILGSFASSLGLFTHPSTFILPFVFIILLGWDGIFHRTGKRRWFGLVAAFVCFLPAVLLFLHIVLKQDALFLDADGYVGRKVIGLMKEDPKVLIARTGTYVVRTLLMLHVKGDTTFRYNVPGSPQLDPISGLLFIAGIWYWFTRPQRTVAYAVFVPLVLFMIPSVLPTAPADEVPSMTRTLVATPFIFLIVAGGMDAIYQSIAAKHIRTACIAVGVFFVVVGSLNIVKYFYSYPMSLPNKNAAFDKIIASFIDDLPQTTPVYLTSCCWGDWGEPEPKAIYYRLVKKETRENIIQDRFITSCDSVPSIRPTILIVRPDDTDFIGRVRSCFPGGIGTLHKDRFGQSVFYSFLIPEAKNSE